MSGTRSDQEQGADRPSPSSQTNPPRWATVLKRLRRKTILTPISLTALGLLLGYAAYALYPRTPALSTPDYARLAVKATFPVEFISYQVVQTHPKLAEMKISVVVSGKSPPAGAKTGLLTASPPIGITFEHCHRPACIRLPGRTAAMLWTVPLVFHSTNTATADFFVNASNFGRVADNVTAMAAIPEVLHTGRGTPLLLAEYYIRSANKYDWSTSPPGVISNGYAIWQEDVEGTDTPGRVAVGTNHTNQASDDLKIFLAGALAALGGAAILTAIVEAVHARDWETLGTLRSK
jgi:hypothetical protein